MSGCVASAGTEWSATLAQAVQVTYVVTAAIVIATLNLVFPENIAFPRRILSRDVYYIVVVLESLVLSFFAAHIMFSVPCFWTRCAEQNSNDSIVPSILFVSSWPTFFVLLNILRCNGSMWGSFFEQEIGESKGAGSVIIRPAQLGAYSGVDA